MGETWHVVWWTHLTLPPYDVQGNWQELAEHYRSTPLGSVGALSRPLPSSFAPTHQHAMLLSAEEQALLPSLLRELAKDDGDRVAGGHPVLATVFNATKAHLLVQCPSNNLSQVVGRLKSRLATLLFYRPERKGSDRVLWGKGFWHAELLETSFVAETIKFIEHQRGG